MEKMSSMLMAMLILGMVMMAISAEGRPEKAAGRELKLVQTVTRHGARSSYLLFKGDPTVWNCTLHPFGSIGTDPSDILSPPSRYYLRQYVPGRQVMPGNC